MTRESLLLEILKYEPYKNWQKTGKGRLGLGEWREVRQGNVSAIKLDALGLYDFAAGKQLSSLWQAAESLGIRVPRKKVEASKPPGAGIQIDAARTKINAAINKRLNDKEKYKSDFHAVLWPYFAIQRKIPFPSKREAICWLHARKITVQRFTKDEVRHTEIVVPLLGANGQLVQTVRIEVDENAGCRKIGKRMSGTADMDRACIWGNDNAHEIILFEGIEDAMSFWFSLDQELLANSVVGFVAGHSGYNHVGSIASDYTSRVVVVDNDSGNEGASKNIGLRASETLGEAWLRVCPANGSDCNDALLLHGSNGVREWFDQLERISWPQLRELIDAESEADLEQAKTATFLYHYNRNPWTDAGTVQAFVSMWGSQVRVTEDGSWWIWNGRVWSQDSAMGSVGRKIAALSPVYERLAKMYLKQHMAGPAKEEKCVPALQCEAWAEKLAGSVTQRGVVAMLRGAGELQCEIEDFDRRPELLNLQNGILNFTTGKLEPHMPAAMCSRICSVAWNPDAGCETWDRFMQEITCGDLALLAYKGRQHGYLASGYTSEKAFFFHLGARGNNGKSVEAEILQWIMGSYASTVKCDLFLEDRFGGYASDYELARLPGVRLAVASEVDEKRSWSEAAIKRFTGGTDRVTARHIRQSPFSFCPRFKAIIHGNNRPKLATGDEAFMRRVHLVPYNFVPEVLDIALDTKLKAEGSGILNRIYWGFYEWRQLGLAAPACVLEAREEYQNEAFADVEEFITDNCDVGEEFEEQATRLWRAYQGWCSGRRAKGDCKTQTAFGRELTRLGHEDVKRRAEVDWRKRVHYRMKIKLRAYEDRNTRGEGFDEELD